MYQLTDREIVIRLSDGACIPMVSGNLDFEEYRDWRDAGNLPIPYVPPVVKVMSVTPRQFWLAVNRLGLRSTINAVIAAADQDTKDTVEYSNAIERNNPTLLALAAALGKTEQEIDDLFTLAKSL